jgi:hypothetical protein
MHLPLRINYIALLMVSAAFSCGRLSIAPQDDIATLQVVGGTNVPAGASIEIEMSAVARLSVELMTDIGTLRSDDVTETSRAVFTTDDGGLARFLLRVPLAMPPGEKITLTSDMTLAGDSVLTIVDPELSDADHLEVARGFHVEVIGSSSILMNRAARLAIPPPPPVSLFTEGIYAIVGGTSPPALIRFLPERVETLQGGSDDPSNVVSQVAFGSGTVFRDRLFACTTSGGIFALDASITWSSWWAMMDCNGLTIDRDKLLGDPGSVPMYLNIGGKNTWRVLQPMQQVAVLDQKLLYGDAGWLWLLQQDRDSSFLPGAYLIYSLGASALPEGKLSYLPTVSPFDPMPVLSSLDSPMAGVFTGPASDYGDLLFLASRSSGIISAMRPDRSTFEFLRGLGATPDLAMSPDGDLYAIDATRGEVLRIVQDR